MHVCAHDGGRNPAKLKLRAWREAILNNVKEYKMSRYKTVGADEMTIARYNGASIRKFAEEWRNSGRKLPKLTLVCTSQPVRITDDDTTKVLVEGRYAIGAILDGKPILLGRIVAELGFKLALSGSKERCLERIADLKQALNRTGKYAPKKSGVGNVEGSKRAQK